MTTATAAAMRPSRSSLSAVASFLRTVGIAALAGLGAGIAGALGSRVAMRVSALATEGNCSALVTENGNRCGEITLGGTAGLIVFGGLFFGLFGGLFYAAARPWLAGGAVRRGLLFGLLMLAAAGWTVFDPHNVDFGLFGPALLNVVMFAALFPLFGLVVGPLSDRLDRTLPRPVVGRRPPATHLAAYALVVPLIALATVAVFGIFVSAIASGDPAPLVVFAYVFVLLPLARRRLAERPALTPAGYALFAAPVLVGLVFTLRGVLVIL